MLPFLPHTRSLSKDLSSPYTPNRLLQPSCHLDMLPRLKTAVDLKNAMEKATRELSVLGEDITDIFVFGGEVNLNYKDPEASVPKAHISPESEDEYDSDSSTDSPGDAPHLRRLYVSTFTPSSTHLKLEA